MKTQKYLLTLQDEIVLSERAATEGGHASLDYIPGAAILGAVASKLYAQLDEKAWTVFHSGRVRFGNGLPVSESGQIALPTPLSLHKSKGEVEAGLHNLLANPGAFTATQQPQQVREGYRTLSNEVVHPRKVFRMKTAVDICEGTVAEGQLYGYESLLAGQQFYCQVVADDDVEDALLKEIESALLQGIRLGRSRAQQYGRVAVERTTTQHTPAFQAHHAAGPEYMSIWLTADLAVRTPDGTPATLPLCASWLGLPAGPIVLDKTFARTRRYSPYHGKRRSYDLERTVIRQGSVLTFKLNTPIAAHQLPIALGMYQEAGLGQYIANPAALMDAVFGQSASASWQIVKNTSKAQTAAASQHELVQWLQQRAGNSDQAVQQWSASIADDYLRLLRSARNFKGYTADMEVGPSYAQWGRVAEVGKQCTSYEQLIEQLFKASHAVCKGTGGGRSDKQTETRHSQIQDWEDKYSPSDNFKHWLEQQVNKARDENLPAGRAIATMAGAIVRRLKQPGA